VRRGAAGLEDVLAVEVRALAIRRRDRMDEERLLRLVEPGGLGQRGMEGEQAVEARRRSDVDGERAAQPRVGRLRIRHDDVEAVGSAALDHEDEAALGRRGARQDQAGRRQHAARAEGGEAEEAAARGKRR
jgi:hypothetical protein